MIATVFKYLVIGVAALFALKVAFAIATGLLGIAIAAAPLVLVGWVVYKIASPKKSERQITEADRRWLES